MAKVKEGDFIELEFTGKLADEDKVFDTTDKELAKEEGIYQQQGNYGTVKVVVGEQHVVPGLDQELQGRELGEHTIRVKQEDAFGKKKGDLLKIIPSREFRKQDIKPFVGLEVNIDGQTGTVRSVSGGRTVVDFNHPLAGKDLEYDVNIKKIITGDKEKLEAVLELMGLPYKELKLEEKKATAKVSQELPGQLVEQAQEEIERLTGIQLEFDMPEKEEKQEEE